jgi:ribosomal protein S18 acetylase RimI-like enzyme
MGTIPSVNCIEEASADAAFATIVLSFVGDPAARWSWPRAEDFLHNMPLLARAFGGKAFALGSAYEIGDFAGVALWLPPGVPSDEEALASLIERTAPAAIQQDAAKVFEQMASFHPKEPHWYLPLIGVDPAHQSKGLGDRLMVHPLARCDADGVPAYLESSNPRNITFYQRRDSKRWGRSRSDHRPRSSPCFASRRRTGAFARGLKTRVG